MVFFRRIFRRGESAKPAAERNAAPANSIRKPNGYHDLHRTHVVIDSIDFQVFTDIDEFSKVCAIEGRAALKIRSLKYPDVNLQLFEHWHQRYGNPLDSHRPTNQESDLLYALFLCAGCKWVYPGSFSIRLLNPGSEMVGAAPGGDSFARTGKCPRCGSKESLIAYEYFPRNEITPADIDAIKQYWKHLASTWWSKQQSLSTTCNDCSSRIAHGKGYIDERYFLCGKCVQKGLMTEGLDRLRESPHFYGAALLRRARSFKQVP